jgi:hypothetical protein
MHCHNCASSTSVRGGKNSKLSAGTAVSAQGCGKPGNRGPVSQRSKVGAEWGADCPGCNMAALLPGIVFMRHKCSQTPCQTSFYMIRARQPPPAGRLTAPY